MEYGQCKCDANFRNAKDRRNGYAPEIGLALWAAIYPQPRSNPAEYQVHEHRAQSHSALQP
jgi:hypothetical protein